jgi:hypothetical protein
MTHGSESQECHLATLTPHASKKGVTVLADPDSKDDLDYYSTVEAGKRESGRLKVPLGVSYYYHTL